MKCNMRNMRIIGNLNEGQVGADLRVCPDINQPLPACLEEIVNTLIMKHIEEGKGQTFRKKRANT